MLGYPKEWQAPHLLTKDEIAKFTREYAETFNLNVLTSTRLISSSYNQATKKWTVKLQTPEGQKTVITGHFVQATGIGSAMPYIPELSGRQMYQGVSIHSAHYKSAHLLAEQGAEVGHLCILVEHRNMNSICFSSQPLSLDLRTRPSTS